MKSLFLILLSVLTLNGYTLDVEKDTVIPSTVAPNLLESDFQSTEYLLRVINDYRQSKGVHRLELDTGLVKACKHHAIWMSFYDKAGHSQNRIDSSHVQEIIVNPYDRAMRFSEVAYKRVAENSTNDPGIRDNLAYSIEIANRFRNSCGEGKPDYTASAAMVLGNWIWSEGHHKTMLLKDDADIAGVYQYVYKNAKGEYRVAAVLLISKKFDINNY
jgi:uncharacterized protein YkwD